MNPHIDFVANIPLPGGKRQHHVKCLVRERGTEKGACLSVRAEDDGFRKWTCWACGQSGFAFAPGRALDPSHRPAKVTSRSAMRSTRTGVPSGLSVPAAARWEASWPIIPGTPAANYLRARGCPLPPPGSHLRWNAQVRHGPTGFTGPALLALITDPQTGAPMSVHRTWIDVSGKVTGPGRMYWRKLPKQGVCRLWPDGELHGVLAVGEGIETALSLALLTGAAWAALDAGNLATLPSLPGFKRLTVAVDHDPAGLRAARALGDRWGEAGAEVRYLMSPTPDDDLNDVLRRLGRDGFRDGVDELRTEDFLERFGDE